MKVSYISKILLLVMSTALLYSCTKSNPFSGYPKTVTIKYEVSSSLSDEQLYSIIYTNETGGDTALGDGINVLGNLPYTVVIKRTVNIGDYATLSADVMNLNTGEMNCTLTIYINNKVVESQTFVNTTPAIAYVFQ